MAFGHLFFCVALSSLLLLGCFIWHRKNLLQLLLFGAIARLCSALFSAETVSIL